MQDEITAARRKKRRKVQFRRFLWFTLALVMVLIAVFAVNSVTKTTFMDIGDFFTITFKGGGGYPAMLGSQTPMQAERMSMSYAVLTETELLTYSSRGSQLMSIKHGYLRPGMHANGNRIVLYNIGSRDVSVYNRSKTIASFQTEYAIIDAQVANDGTLAVLTQSDRYACQLSIYRNGDYEEVMTWSGASGFPLGTYMKEDGTTVVAGRIVAHDGVIETVITSINLNKKTQNYEMQVAGMVLAAYFEGDTLVAITDQAAYQINRDGAIANQYDFPGIPVLSIARDQNSNIAIAFGDNNQYAVNQVVILSKTVTEQSVIESCGTVKDMYFSGNRLYILGNRQVSEYSGDGKLKKRYEADFNTLIIFDLNGLVAIMPDRAERLTKPITEEEA